MFIEDYHTHTSVSPDGEGDIYRLCVRADEIGLKYLCVTEHVELNRFFSPGHYAETPRNEFEVYYDGSIFENAMSNCERVKKESHIVDLSAGVELGQINADIPLAKIVYSDKRLDFVIGSLHELIGKEDFYNLDYKKEDCEMLLEEYFSQLLDIAKSGAYDVLGHITYPLRYMEGEYGYKPDMSKYISKIREIYEAVIDSGKGIELNTSGLRQKYGKTFPDYDLLKIYHDMGGKIITLGSDAHNSIDLAKGTDKGLEMLKNIGFQKISYFKNHEAYDIKI